MPSLPASNPTAPFRLEKRFHLPEATSTHNRFADAQIPQNPWMAPNDFGSPHQDSWCSESVSLDGPTSGDLLLIEQYNPFGYTPNMVCNSHGQMVGVSLDYATGQFWIVVFEKDCTILAAGPAGTTTPGTFGGGYFYMDNDDNTVLVQNNQVASYATQHVEAAAGPIQDLSPTWTSADIIELVGAGSENSLYSSLPVWDEDRPNLYWCLIAGKYDEDTNTLVEPAYMAAVEIVPGEGAEGGCTTTLLASRALDNQWNNNTFAVDERGAYIVTNGLDPDGQPTSGFLWAFAFDGDEVAVRWKTPYDNAGYLKPGQKNIGSGTTPTLTRLDDGTELVGITDNADPQLNVLICDRGSGEPVATVPCFQKRRSADEASLIGVGGTFVAENNFGHYPTWPHSQFVPNGPGMSLIDVDPGGDPSADTIWTLPNVHFYAMNMLCRGSGIIFAHTCDWTDDVSATEGGMYYISAIDAFDGRVIWRIPLGRGVNYCHEYGGIYFDQDGDLFIGTNQYLVSIQNFVDRAAGVKADGS